MQAQMDSLLNSIDQTFKQELILILLKLSQNIEEGKRLPTPCYEASITPHRAKQTHHKKRKSQTDLSHKYGHKNPRENTNKPIQQHIRRIIHHDQLRFILEIQGFRIQKSINITQCINRIRGENPQDHLKRCKIKFE